MTAIDPALLSRFHVSDVQGPTGLQCAVIGASINRDLVAQSEWSGRFDRTRSRDVVDRLCALSSRVMRRALEHGHETQNTQPQESARAA